MELIDVSLSFLNRHLHLVDDNMFVALLGGHHLIKLLLNSNEPTLPELKLILVALQLVWDFLFELPIHEKPLLIVFGNLLCHARFLFLQAFL